MIFKTLSSIALKFKRQVFASLYAFDCITYTIVFFSLFLFISYLSSSSVNRETQFFDILIFTITLIQCLRPLLMILYEETELIVRDISLAFVFGGIYFFFYQINQIAETTMVHYPIVFQIRTVIEIFFYSVYILFTFSRVSPFLRSIKMDFLYSFTFGFIFLIFFGTWLLSLPVSRTTEIPLLDLVFTATSCVTVTGLTVIDISKDLTLYGRLVIMGLVQIGGLGILTFSTLYMINFKNRLSFGERMYTASLFSTNKAQDINTLLRWIILFTFSIESIGALFLYIGTLNLNITPAHQFFFAIFNSIAAFCNAGVSLISSNMRYFYDNPLVLYTLSFLIIFGGLGFITVLELRKKIMTLFHFKHPKAYRGNILSGQTKVVLFITIILLVFGTVCFYFLERNNVLAHMTFWQQINNSFFASATTRTAGFQSSSTLHLREATIWLCIILMFIGTSPNATGGGIKITTLFVLIWALIKVAAHRNESQEPILGFNFSKSLVANAGLIFFLRISILCLAVFLMSVYESAPLHSIIFEAVSAFSTVGLSQNLTPLLAPQSKTILILLMFIGRVGSFYILSNIFPFNTKKSSILRKQQTISLE